MNMKHDHTPFGHVSMSFAPESVIITFLDVIKCSCPFDMLLGNREHVTAAVNVMFSGCDKHNMCQKQVNCWK